LVTFILLNLVYDDACNIGKLGRVVYNLVLLHSIEDEKAGTFFRHIAVYQRWQLNISSLKLIQVAEIWLPIWRVITTSLTTVGSLRE
jgi:hypothetical protein